MKISFRIALGVSLLIPVMAVSIVTAHEDDVAATTSTTTSTTEKKVENPDEKLTIQQRLEKRKTEMNIKQLPNAEKLKITSKCKASQGVISSVKGRVTGIITSRDNTYGELTERLTKLNDKLKSQGADTTQLQAQITVLTAKIETFHNDLDTYQLAVSDLSTMDCTADPAAFKASLESARKARDKVRADANDIRIYVKDTIKPTLQAVRKQLEANKESDN